MTEQEINVAVAEACGWKIDPDFCGVTDPQGVHRFRGYDPVSKLIPNYCTDLNAMHEAEKTLNEKQQVWYLQKLTQVRLKEGVGGMIACMIDKTTFATARQRAEAFLRTLGKWKE